MRVFLRNKQSRVYWADSDGWVVGGEHAFDFIKVPRAARFALHECSAEMEIVLKCGLLPDEVIMPVLPEYCHSDYPDADVA